LDSESQELCIIYGGVCASSVVKQQAIILSGSQSEAGASNLKPVGVFGSVQLNKTVSREADGPS